MTRQLDSCSQCSISVTALRTPVTGCTLVGRHRLEPDPSPQTRSEIPTGPRLDLKGNSVHNLRPVRPLGHTTFDPLNVGHQVMEIKSGKDTIADELSQHEGRFSRASRSFELLGPSASRVITTSHERDKHNSGASCGAFLSRCSPRELEGL